MSCQFFDIKSFCRLRLKWSSGVSKLTFFKVGSKAHLGGSLDCFGMLIYGAASSVWALAACKGRQTKVIHREREYRIDLNLQYNQSERETWWCISWSETWCNTLLKLAALTFLATLINVWIHCINVKAGGLFNQTLKGTYYACFYKM